MKTIKLIGMCLLAAVLCMSLQSCSKDDYQSRIKELIINENNYKFNSDGGSYTREYRNEDLSCFKVSSNVDWCTAVIDHAKSTLTVAVEENETFDSRTAIVTLIDVIDGVSSRSFTVSQGQCDVIQTGEDSYEVGTNGGTVSVAFKSNVSSYKVQIIYNNEGNKDWITIPGNKTRGLVDHQLPLEVAKNTSQEERSAVVRIYDEKTDVEDQVLILQKFEATFKLQKTTFEIDERGGNVDILVESNADFQCYMNPEDSWAKKGDRTKISDDVKCQTIVIAPFTEKKSKRETLINFSNTFGSDVDVTIIQTRYLYIKETSLKLMKLNSQTITLVNEKKWGVKWTSSDENIATVDENGKVTAVESGGAIITVTSEDGNHTDQIAVTVEKPADLGSSLAGSNEPGYDNVEGVKVMTSLECTIINNSENAILLSEVSLYCDGEFLKSKALNKTLNKGGDSFSHEFAIDVEREPVPEESKDEEKTDEEKTDEGKTDEEKTGGDSADDSSNGGRAGSRADTDTEGATKPKVNTHKYYVVWDYSYGGEKFQFTYPDSKASTRRYTRR
ncbi:MAG: Ig-like domain-containing protein [Prevotella sp.]|nr:Ig-like domain-containing protein [Prevotella sp.]